MTLGNPANIDTSIRQQAYNTWPLKQTNKISAKYCMPVNCAHSRMGRCISWIGHHCWIMQWWENNPIVNSCINIALEDFWTKKVFSLWCVPRKGHFVTVNASDILKTCFIRPYIGARKSSLKSLTTVIKVSQIQNEFMRSSFLSKCKSKITRISALPYKQGS